MKVRIAAVAAALVATACGGHAPQVTQATGYRLYEAAARQVALIDTRSQSAHQHLPLGTPSPDWHHYYTVSAGSLLDIDPETGTTITRLTLPGDYQLPPATSTGIPGGLSPNGAWLVLQRFDSASHLLVIDTTFAEPPMRIELPGHFQFDAISDDGARLYLIQKIGDGQYHVRDYNLVSASLDPNFIVDKSEGGEAMSGLRLSGVAARDGSMLFSVYARAHKGAFIHALSLDGPFALCLDLPGTGYEDGSQESLDWSLALSPDGNRLYVSNPAMGVVVEFLASNLTAGHVFHTSAPSPTHSAGAVVSADSRTLVIAGSTGVVWLDAGTLAPIGQALPDWTVRSLALSPDGSTLYAVNDRGALAELSMESHSLTSAFDPGIAQPIALMRVEALP